MKNKSFGSISLMLAFALIVSLIAGCSSGNNSGNASSAAPSNSAPDTESKKPVDDKPVNITFWYALSGANGEAFKAMIDEFNSSQSRITVEAVFSGSYADTATKMATALASKTEPNGALMAAGPLYTGPQENTSILEMMQGDADFKMDDIYDGMWDYTKYNGKIVAVPYNISTQLIYYNADIFKAAGIDVNQPPKTWEELLDYAKKAKANGNINKSDDFWGLDTSDSPWLFKSMLMQNGNSVVENVDGVANPLFENAEGVETAEFWQTLVNENVMPAGQHDLAEKKFLAGNLAMIAATSARTAKWASGQSFEIGAFALPSRKKAAVALGGGALVQFNKSEREDQATYELIKFLMDKNRATNFALNTGYLPIYRSALEMADTQKAMGENPMYQVAFNQLADSTAYWNFDDMGTMDFMIYEALEKVEKGDQKPADAMKSLSEGLKTEMGVK